jgi:hypothetical protein
MATGLGKTWLAAFDAAQMGAARILFLAHREEILTQAAATFLRLRPTARVGFYAGQQRDRDADLLMASVQTLSRQAHLDTLDPERYDYIVVDEFHHAAASTYRRILRHVRPRFLLGLTATPDRTDQSDILSLCDDNLVFRCDLFDGIETDQLAPFHYFGIVDDSVEYHAIPWRNGRFDPETLDASLVTQARSAHTLREWERHHQRRALAFCASRRHADYVSAYFEQHGVRSAAVYGGSRMGRTEALEQLTAGHLDVIFSVDLFSEGVDVPAVDTILMLRPTESKILFLQQLGRGLRRHPDKDHLVVLDFIANHKSFLHKPAALLNCSLTHNALAAAAGSIAQGTFVLPPGCTINFDLSFIDFMQALQSQDGRDSYRELRTLLGRRPTAAEFWRAGASFTELRRQYGHWFAFVAGEGDLDTASRELAEAHAAFLREVEVTPMTKSFKMVTLEAFQSLNGWRTPPTLDALAERAWHVIEERGTVRGDLPSQFQARGTATTPAWRAYWRGNPIAAWIGEGAEEGAPHPFRIAAGRFEPRFTVRLEDTDGLADFAQELIDFRLARYEQRPSAAVAPTSTVAAASTNAAPARYIPIYDDLVDALRGTLASRSTVLSRRFDGFEGDLFIAPGVDGTLITDAALYTRPGATPTATPAGPRVYLNDDGLPVVSDGPTPKASAAQAIRLSQLTTLDLALEQDFQREDIPELFGERFNPGNWNVGHVVLPQAHAHVLLITLNKQGKAAEHRYHDRWLDDRTFEWQTQNATTPLSKRGLELIEHLQRGISLHLFIRPTKLGPDGRAAPFRYFGQMRYRTHTGSAPMTVVLDRID